MLTQGAAILPRGIPMMQRHAATLLLLLAVACGSTRPSADIIETLAADAAGELSADEIARADTQPAPASNLRVMTFNVLCFFCNDIEYDPWEDRLVYFGDLFARHQPDLIGLQELLFEDEVKQIIEEAPGYSALFFEDDVQELFKDYADATILYRTDRFEVVDNGFYWLSETPDTPLAGGWADTNLPRLVAWAHLR